jgi:hypothetical protein
MPLRVSGVLDNLRDFFAHQWEINGGIHFKPHFAFDRFTAGY